MDGWVMIEWGAAPTERVSSDGGSDPGRWLGRLASDLIFGTEQEHAPQDTKT